MDRRIFLVSLAAPLIAGGPVALRQAALFDLAALRKFYVDWGAQLDEAFWNLGHDEYCRQRQYVYDQIVRIDHAIRAGLEPNPLRGGRGT